MAVPWSVSFFFASPFVGVSLLLACGIAIGLGLFLVGFGGEVGSRRYSPPKSQANGSIPKGFSLGALPFEWWDSGRAG